ncbi:hypothetical protein [Nonomuraea sp. KM90]|uniref:hypothetical protein n=1 Tax=Nonomuraea sp. KM90 TaxID=3457428 RepID=UPI003FCE8101
MSTHSTAATMVASIVTRARMDHVDHPTRLRRAPTRDPKRTTRRISSRTACCCS